MHYMLMPLDQHFDGGLGATGEAFEEAANLVNSSSENISHTHVHLPVSFLYRHAIELYLKSIIVTIHRALTIPYGSEPHNGPAFVPVTGKWKPIYKIHSVAILWAHVLELIRDSEPVLKTRCKTDWQNIPDDLISAISTIEQLDGSSTFFRYPDDRRPDAEQAKSSWKSKNVEDIMGGMGPGNKPIKAFLIFDQNDTLAESFQYDDAPLAEIVNLLAKTTETLSCFHVGLRVELAGGF